MDLDVKIAIGTAIASAFTVTLQTDLLAAADSGRNGYFDLFLDIVVALAAAMRTDLLDAFACALAIRTDALL